MATALLPRRQSCDRCHERKVRCVPTTGPRETTASEPRACDRCQKAGLGCVYSPQLRPGRPVARKEASRRLSSASSSIVALPTAASCPVRGTSLDTDSTLLQPFQNMDGPMSPVIQDNGDGCDSLLDLDLDIDADSGLGFGDWLPLRDGSDGNEDPSKRHADTVLPLPPPILPRGPPATNSVDVERDIQELSDLNLRIYRTARAIDAESADTPLSMSSPSVGQIFDAGCTLTHILTRLAGCSAQDAPDGSSSAVCCADTGVLLMVLACHERLLDSFEAMSVAMNSHVQSMTFSPSSVMQVMMITKVISHVLNRVDRAIAPLQGQPRRGTSEPSLLSVSDAANSPGEPSSAFRQVVDVGLERPSECSKMAAVALDTMQSRQNRLRAHLKVVKLLVKGTNVLPVT